MCNNILHETNCDKRQVNCETRFRKQFNGIGYSNTYLFKEVELGKRGGSLHLPILTTWMARLLMAVT